MFGQVFFQEVKNRDTVSHRVSHLGDKHIKLDIEPLGIIQINSTLMFCEFCTSTGN